MSQSEFKPFPFYKRIIWRMFGKRNVGVDCTEDTTTHAISYTLFGVTFVSSIITVEHL